MIQFASYSSTTLACHSVAAGDPWKLLVCAMEHCALLFDTVLLYSGSKNKPGVD